MPRTALARFATVYFPRVLLGGCLGLLGCDGAAPDGYLGEPLAVFEGPTFGSSTPEATGAAAQGRFRFALFWSGPGLDGEIEHGGAAGDPGDRRYRLPLFEIGPLAGPWAVGRMVAYVDDDGDGRRGPDEAMGGALDLEGVLYVAEPIDAAASPTGRALTAGFHRIPLPMPCGATPRPINDTPCEVTVGSVCTGGTFCAEGVCTARYPRQWRTQVCLLEGAEPVCTPADAVWVPGPVVDVWVPACAADADCPEDTACLDVIGGCVSTAEGLFRFGQGPNAVPPPVCVGDG